MESQELKIQLWQRQTICRKRKFRINCLYHTTVRVELLLGRLLSRGTHNYKIFRLIFSSIEIRYILHKIRYLKGVRTHLLRNSIPLAQYLDPRESAPKRKTNGKSAKQLVIAKCGNADDMILLT